MHARKMHQLFGKKLIFSLRKQPFFVIPDKEFSSYSSFGKSCVHFIDCAAILLLSPLYIPHSHRIPAFHRPHFTQFHNPADSLSLSIEGSFVCSEFNVPCPSVFSSAFEFSASLFFFSSKALSPLNIPQSQMIPEFHRLHFAQRHTASVLSIGSIELDTLTSESAGFAFLLHKAKIKPMNPYLSPSKKPRVPECPFFTATHLVIKPQKMLYPNTNTTITTYNITLLLSSVHESTKDLMKPLDRSC